MSVYLACDNCGTTVNVPESMEVREVSSHRIVYHASFKRPVGWLFVKNADQMTWTRVVFCSNCVDRDRKHRELVATIKGTFDDLED